MSDFRQDQERLMRQLEERLQFLEQQEEKRAAIWRRLRAKIIKDLRRLGIPDEKAASMLPPEMPPADWVPDKE
jgi:hypothetical protein